MEKQSISTLIKRLINSSLLRITSISYSKLLPLVLILSISYGTVKYKKGIKYFFFKNESGFFSSEEQKTISKKISPLIKFKNIEKLYSQSSIHVLILNEILILLKKDFNIKTKPQVFLIKSDIFYMNILSNGVLIITDQLYFKIKEQSNGFELLLLFIVHSLFHVKTNDTSRNLGFLYSWTKLIDQYTSLLESDNGNEHYFLNYFLYLPFTKRQEVNCILNSIQYLDSIGLFQEDSKVSKYINSFDSHVHDFNHNCKWNKKMKYHDLIYSYFKVHDYIKYFQSYEKAQLKKEIYSSNGNDNQSKAVKSIIYGDIFDEEVVDVNIHQRTFIKVKYYKNAYDKIHKLDENVKKSVLDKISDYETERKLYQKDENINNKFEKMKNIQRYYREI